ncbi:MAG: hypothetical protein KA477_00425 [Candidatus Levybacteria bacterium]|nr:hypothetical protein [Candidatus Levybacteria bacterium]
MSWKLGFFIISALVIGLSLRSQTYAQDVMTATTNLTADSTTPTPSTTMSRKDEIKNRLKGNALNSTLATEDKMSEKTASNAAISELRRTRKAEIEKIRLEKKSEMAVKKAEFEEQLQTLKDETKKQIAEKISERLTTSNTNATNRMFEIIDKLNEIMLRIEAKVTDAKTNGIDTTVQEEGIQNAKFAIQGASDAITEQAAKEYIITVGDDTTLRNDVGTVVSQQKQDLRTTYELVRSARQAVRQVAKSLKDLLKTTMNSESEATTSALPNTVASPVSLPVQ